jgi:N-formylglutamate deformylase
LSSDSEAQAPYVVQLPSSAPAPLVVASPHSGSRYPEDFIAQAQLALRALRRSEDSFVDELFSTAPAHGASFLAATFPRAFCDVNREAWELDPAMFEDPLPAWVNTTSPRIGAGLGTIARVVSSGQPIYGARLKFAEAERRVRGFWQPYHDALDTLIGVARGRSGICLLLDCHSMPAAAAEGRKPAPDIVLGDAHGTACAPALVQLVEQMLSSRGYAVRRNDPYAGGYVTRHYGRPARDIHAMQIEIARGLYMNEEALERSPGFARVAADMEAVIARLAVEAARLSKG